MANHKVDTSQSQVLHDLMKDYKNHMGKENQKKKYITANYPNKPWLVKKKKKNQMDGMGKKKIKKRMKRKYLELLFMINQQMGVARVIPKNL